MNCKKVESYFSAYSENDLDLKTKRLLETHLSRCETCASEWRAFRNTLRLLNDMPFIEPSQDFDWKLRSRLAREELNRIGIWQRMFGILRTKQSLVFSSVIGILLVFVGLYLHSSKESPPIQNEQILVRYVTHEIPSIQMNEWSDLPNFEAQLKSQLELKLPRDVFDTNYVIRTVNYADFDTGGGL